MSVLDINPKITNKTNSVVPVSDNKDPDAVCTPIKEATVSAETMAAIAQHPLADLFGKYGGGYWDELFAALEQDRQDRQNGRDEQEESAVPQK